jgi:hypothetical protein
VARSTLSDLAAATTELASPALLVIGDVAALEVLAPRSVVPRALDHVA